MAKKGMKRPESTASAAQNRSQSGAQNMAGGSKGKSEPTAVLSTSPPPASEAGMFCKKDCPPGHTRPGVMGTMEPRKREAPRSTLGEDLRLNPQLRLCARFDDVSIAEFPVAAPGEMGVRVVDNCAEENIQ